MKRLVCAIFLVPLIAVATPSKKDKEEVSQIVDRSGTILGGLIECDRYDMRDSYLESLRDALSVYPVCSGQLIPDTTLSFFSA